MNYINTYLLNKKMIGFLIFLLNLYGNNISFSFMIFYSYYLINTLKIIRNILKINLYIIDKINDESEDKLNLMNKNIELIKAEKLALNKIFIFYLFLIII